MSPFLADDDFENRYAAYSELFSEFSGARALRVPLSNLHYFGLIEFCMWLVYTMAKPEFLSGILHIFRISSEPQVGRINARRIVSGWTIVQNVKPFWNLSTKQLPRITMRRNFYSLYLIATIATFALCALPNPASLSLNDVTKESVLTMAVAFQGTAMIWLLFDESRNTLEFPAAHTAFNNHTDMLVLSQPEVKPI